MTITRVEIDSHLLAEAMKLSDAETAKKVVEEALELLIRVRKQVEAAKLRGELAWSGDLDEMRLDR